MISILTQDSEYSVVAGIESHPAWHGLISGVKAEKTLKGNQPYQYLLRAGEEANEYYVSYILPDLTVHHQPFVITIKNEGWYFENGASAGPFSDELSLNDVLHFIMHTTKCQISPLTAQ